MPPAGRDSPLHPFTHFNLPHGLKRAGVVRARAVGCLTEPGIVCFPAVSQTRHRILSNHKAGKHHEAREGVPADLARTTPARDSRMRHKAMPPADR
jgi:hypothetical protein